MQTRHLGRHGSEVSTIGLGTWPIGGARYGPSDDADAIATIRAALDAGITLFDTAPSYGNGHAEALLGQALEGVRDEVVLVTKGGLVWNEKSEVLGQDGRREHIEIVLEESLRRLRTDHVDVFLIHWPDTTMSAGETAATLRGLVESGKTRHVGVSNYTGEAFRELATSLGDIPLVTNQVSFHLFDRRWARSTFAACRDLGAGVMAYGSLAHGLLTGTFRRSTTFDGTDWRASGVIFGQPLLADGNRERNLEVVDRLAGIASSFGMSLPEMALRWVLSHAQVSASLVGARTPGEIASAATASEGTLDAACLEQIDAAMKDAVGMAESLAV